MPSIFNHVPSPAKKEKRKRLGKLQSSKGLKKRKIETDHKMSAADAVLDLRALSISDSESDLLIHKSLQKKNMAI